MAKYNHTLSSPLIGITSALAAAAWLILFIGACAAQFHGVTWFIILYELALLIFIIFLLATNRFNRYRNMAYMFMAISLAYLTWLCQWTLNRNYVGGARAASAGAVILIIVEFIWALELTAPGGGTWASRGSLDSTKEKAVNFGQKIGNSVRPDDHKGSKKPLPRDRDEESASYSVDSDDSDSITHFEKATALHDYGGSPDDPNELSFEKGEVIEILDRRGNWWQARKQDGTTGIVPSNYF